MPGEDNHNNGTVVNQPTAVPACFLQVIPMLQLTMFWKWAIVIMAVLMAIFAWTLFSLAKATEQQTAALVAGKYEILQETRAVLTAIQHHQQISLENRNVQSEVKGLVESHLKSVEQQIHQLELQHQRK